MLSLETQGYVNLSTRSRTNTGILITEFSDLPRRRSGAARKRGLVGRQGFEPWKPMATDLQSAPFVHLGTCPNIAKVSRFNLVRAKTNHPAHSFPAR